MRKTEQMDKHESLLARHSELLAVFARGRSSPSATPRGIAHIRLNKKVGHIMQGFFLMMCPIYFYQKREYLTMKKLKMTVGKLIFEEGCNKYPELGRQRNLRDGTVRHYRQRYLHFFIDIK